MEYVLTGQKNCDIFDTVFFDNENSAIGFVDLACKKAFGQKSLATQVYYFDGNLSVNDELADKKTFKIALDLAKAVDKNSVSEIKHIKNTYGATKEFAKAKDFLNKKCKIVWDVSENKAQKMKIPHEAMKVLGITNKPTLGFLLDNSLKYYENENGSTTVQIIESILKNPNLEYKFDDIFSYLKQKYQNENCRYNFVTAKYVANLLNYSASELELLGIEKEILNKIFTTLSWREKLHYVCCKMNLCR